MADIIVYGGREIYGYKNEFGLADGEKQQQVLMEVYKKYDQHNKLGPRPSSPPPARRSIISRFFRCFRC